MTPEAVPVPWPEVENLLAGISFVTGLRIAVVPSGGREEAWGVGDEGVCEIIRATREGFALCRECHELVSGRAAEGGRAVFDLCHARLGQVAVPVVAGDGLAGTITICGAFVNGLSEEHKQYLSEVAGRIGLRDPRALLRAASEGPTFSRTRLAALGDLVWDQVREKVAAAGSLEETTELFLRKYEELMFLYAITENLTPEMEYGRVLAVILDKGLQRLSARAGLFLLAGAGAGDLPRVVTAYGQPLFPEGGGVPDGLARLLASLDGPALVEADPAMGLLPQSGGGRILVHPFGIKSAQTGFLVISPVAEGSFSEPEMRFVKALANQASTVLHNVHLYREISDLLFSTLQALSTAIDAKDAYTRGHSTRVAEYSVRIARTLGFGPKDLTLLKIAGLLHDFGKVLVSQQVLQKSSTLSLSEKDAMERHPVVGAQILGKFKAFAEVVPGVRHHHERWDGKGYPDGLRGEEIPLQGRILAVADAFDAMVTSRPYRGRIALQQALGEITANAGEQFDPAVVDAFLATMEASAGGAGTEAGGHGQG